MAYGCVVGHLFDSLDAASILVPEDAPQVIGYSPCHLTGEFSETSGQNMHHVAGVVVFLLLYSTNEATGQQNARAVGTVVQWLIFVTPLPIVPLLQWRDIFGTHTSCRAMRSVSCTY